MPTPETFATFLFALALLELSPGPDMMMVMARGLGQGRRTALYTMSGMVFVAGIIQVGMLVLGLAALIHSWPLGLDFLRWAGAAYLIWLGIKMLRSSATASTRAQSKSSISDWQAVKDGAINSLTNPKSLLFMFAFLPQFVNPAQGPIWLQLLILGTIQKLAGVISLGAVAIAAGSIGQWMARHPAVLIWQERFTGLVMILLGARLLLVGGSAGTAIKARS
ncbi:LysE family translocator [Pantoea sp. Acro-805]|uniref:LysE family translocator n=1 Tax=Candidatus Pantoea formicae TaxID=2608355 RepID=A0ABX0R0W1_9GAMM|nr:LysE family translocator [Pantoea formicae]NIF00742.1 LysE family translocator [Pantoea formicae]